jgi:hypothetical protein
MPLQKLVFKPGINKEGTNYTNEGGWFDCDKVRFRSGNAEKIGGWTRLSNDTYQGAARALWNWGTLAGANLLGVGTHLKYYIEQGGEYNDVTPLRATYTTSTSPSTNNMFSTTNGSNVVTVTLSGYGGENNDFVTISGSTAVGGIPAAQLNIEQQITYVSTSQFTFTTTTAATSTVAAGGGTAITAAFQINTGLDVEIAGTGWGAGTWPSYVDTTLTNPFTAASAGVSVLTVTKTAHGLTTGDYVYFSSISANACGINRLVLQKAFPITYTGANTFTISTVIGSNTYTTSSTAASGGTVIINTPVAPVRGWGAVASVGIAQQLRLWTNDNFGQDLVLAPRGGEIYYWIPTGQTYPSGAVGGLGTRAQQLSVESTAAGYSGQFVPNSTNQIIGSAIQRFVVAFGANPYDPANANNAFDPLLVRWSDQENPYEWVPAVTNQSGEYRLNIGSFIVCARSTRQEILVWSDAALYSMQYLGPPYVWGFQLLQDNISIMGPNASITVNNVTYWMGTDKFYRYNGRVETLPCALRQYVYQDINQNQNFQVFAGSIEGYNEIWWFYCSADSNTIDRYIIYDYLDDVWAYGTMSRTAWLDSGLRTFPMGADTVNYRILYHENGVDDVSGLTPEPIVSYIQSSDFDIGDGYNFGFVWRILPDLTFNGSSANLPEVTMVVLPRVNSGTAYGAPNAPGVASTQNYTTQKTYAVQQFTGQVYTRIRGRQMAYRIESTGLGVAWQMGYPRIDIRPDGRR